MRYVVLTKGSNFPSALLILDKCRKSIMALHNNDFLRFTCALNHTATWRQYFECTLNRVIYFINACYNVKAITNL